MLQKEVEKLEADENAVKSYLMDVLPKNDATGISGKLVRVSLVPKTRVSVTDWDAVYAYIAKTYKKDPGVFALLQRRPSEEAVKDLWANGANVPGMEAYPYMSLSHSVVK